jgi:hypothetical protein
MAGRMTAGTPAAGMHRRGAARVRWAPAGHSRRLPAVARVGLAVTALVGLAILAPVAPASTASGPAAAGGLAAFRAAVPAGVSPTGVTRRATPPRILVFGDGQPWGPGLDVLVNPIFTRVTTAMLARLGGLAIGLGDYVYAKFWCGGVPAGTDSRTVLARRYRAFKRNEGRLAARMPVLLAIGNHEGVDETVVDSATPFPGAAAWRAAFALPSAPGAGERYYSYDWRGKVHVVVLFSKKSGLGFAGPGRPGNSAQARWLIDDLRHDRHLWTVVALHHPIYDPRYGHAWFSHPAERDRLASFLRRQGVDLVLQGHDHFYRRHVQAGVPYVTQGGAGAQLTPAILGDARDVVRYMEWGFSEIEFRGDYRRATLRAWIVEDDGSTRLGDRVVLKRNLRR